MLEPQDFEKISSEDNYYFHVRIDLILYYMAWHFMCLNATFRIELILRLFIFRYKISEKRKIS